MIRYIIVLFACILLFACQKDPRVNDFKLEYEKHKMPFYFKNMKGTITNISDEPAAKITLKIDKYVQNGNLASFNYIRIKEILGPNESAGFCEFLADSITRVSIQVTEVD